MPKTAYQLNQWSKEWPTKENANEWLFVRHIRSGFIYMMEVRVDDCGELYLSKECNDGITKTSYGNALSMYQNHPIEFCGPIQMPPNYRA